MSKTRFLLLAILLLTVAGFLRMVDLEADPPANFADRSQDLTTDGSYITYYARNEALFDSKTIVDDEVWTFIDISLVSNVARLLYSFTPVSQITTNLAGAIPSIIGIFLFALAFVRAKNGYLIALLVLAILSVNYPLIVYSRVPLSENGLIFFTGLATLIFSRWRSHLWGLIGLGLAIAVAALFGKIFGLALIVPALVVLNKSNQPESKRTSALLLSSLGIGGVLILFLFYGSSSPLSTFWSLGVTAHGFPKGLSSVSGFFEKLILFGYKGMYKYAPVLSILFWLTISIRLLVSSKKQQLTSLELFLIVWIATAWVVLSPFNYLPLRYLIFLYLPMVGFAVSVLLSFMNESLELGGAIKKWKFILLLFVNWLFSVHAISWPLRDSLNIEKPADAVWISLVIACLLTVGEYLFLRKKRVLHSGFISLKLVGASVILIVGVGLFQFISWYSNQNYTISYASQDVGTIVGNGAIIAGQDGPALCVGTDLKSYPYFLTPDIADFKEKLTDYPITHVAILKESWNKLAKKWWPLVKLPIVGRFMIRTNNIYLIRVADLGLNLQSRIYQKTDYEIGIDFLGNNQFDSALVYQQSHLVKFPYSRACLIELFYLHATRGEFEKCLPIANRLREQWPTDYSVQLMSAILFKELARQNNNKELLAEAKECLALSVKGFPDNEANLLKAYEKFQPFQRIIY